MQKHMSGRFYSRYFVPMECGCKTWLWLWFTICKLY